MLARDDRDDARAGPGCWPSPTHGGDSPTRSALATPAGPVRFSRRRAGCASASTNCYSFFQRSTKRSVKAKSTPNQKLLAKPWSKTWSTPRPRLRSQLEQEFALLIASDRRREDHDWSTTAWRPIQGDRAVDRVPPGSPPGSRRPGTKIGPRGGV
jgi:hypothetical protein